MDPGHGRTPSVILGLTRPMHPSIRRIRCGLPALKLLLLVLFACCEPSGTARAAGRRKSTYVIIHGAFGGGWDWRAVDDRLTRAGHRVYRPTLTGLGERVHLSSPDIGLQTHVRDIINVIRYENLTNVTLVAHSYGGVVATRVLDAIPERIGHVVFLDAAIPDHGESFLSFWSKMEPAPQAAPVDERPASGFATLGDMSTNSPPSEVPHPWNTLADRVEFRNPAAPRVPGTYVFFMSKGQRPGVVDSRFEYSVSMHAIWSRAVDRGYAIETLESDHLAERTHPRELAALLAGIGKGRHR